MNYYKVMSGCGFSALLTFIGQHVISRGA